MSESEPMQARRVAAATPAKSREFIIATQVAPSLRTADAATMILLYFK
jgi:hypothetical protein